jgi:hypothetical protein
MKTETRMDYLMHRLEAMNELLNVRQEGDPEFASATDKKGKSGKGEGKAGGFFGAVTTEMFFRGDGAKRPRIIGITHPSDGHPQEELTPDFGWFRALAHNNPTWTLYWPELII